MRTAPTLAAVVPAAGLATRFGSRKLLADVDGVPLLQRTIASLLDAGVASVVVVIRDGERFDGVRSLADPRVLLVSNPDPDRGMFSSIQAGLAAADGDVLLVLPADMPFVAAATIAAVAARAADTRSIVVPVHDGRTGHPLAIPRSIRDGLVALPATTTLKDGLARFGERGRFDVGDAGVLHDVDVPADLVRRRR